MTTRNGRTTIAIAALVCALACGAAGARERPWFKYENAYFEAYSDDSEKQVRRLLTELENFRAAVNQVLELKMPAGIPKTQVIAFRSARDFRRLTGDRRIAAFVTGIDGIPHIVLPVGSAGDEEQSAIRHEYTHVLLGYSELRFPPWYQEGFAEFMSGTQFRDKGTKFTLGDVTGRRQSPAGLVPWEDLMDDDFAFHTVRTIAKGSNAYFQSWLLVHYLTIGDKFKYYDQMSMYLGRFAAGESSAAALEAEFGMTPEEIGNLVFDEYRRRMPYYIIAFRPGIQDPDFERSPTSTEGVQETIDAIRVRVEASGWGK